MLELFAVRGQLAVSMMVHVTLAAAAWTATLLTVEAVRRSDGDAPVAQRMWSRARTLGTASAVSGLVVLAQLGIFWRAAFEVAGAALWLPVGVATIASLARALLLRAAPQPSGPWTHGRPLQAALLGTLSGATALLALAWLSHPTGTTTAADGTLLTSVGAAFASPHGWIRTLHLGGAAVVVGGVCFAIGAARRSDTEDLRLALSAALVALTLQAVTGVAVVRSTGIHEPVKLAAMAAQWPSVKAAPLRLGAWPYDFGEHTTGGVAIPGLLARWVHGAPDATVEGLLATPMEARPPIAGLYMGLHARVLSGVVGWIALLVATVRLRRGATSRWLLALLAGPALLLSWSLAWWSAEMGRSPWTIRGVLRVGDATWLPYGMAPTALLWVGLSLALAVWAFRRCRALPSAPASPGEPASPGNV